MTVFSQFPEYAALVEALFDSGAAPKVGSELAGQALRSGTAQYSSVIVGLCGPKGCGKSTIAAELGQLVCGLERHQLGISSYPFMPLRFAGTLKAMLRTMGLTEAQVDGAEKEVPCDLLGGHTPRHAQKTIGTEWGREMIVDDLWVRVTMAKIDVTPGYFVALDDVRFANEAEAIRARGGYVIELTRPGAAYDDEHASEVGVPREMIDASFANDGDAKATALAVLLYVATRRSEGQV